MEEGLEIIPSVSLRPAFRPPRPPPAEQPTPTHAMYRTNYRFVIGWRTFIGWCDPIMCCLSLTVGPCRILGCVVLVVLLAGFFCTHTCTHTHAQRNTCLDRIHTYTQLWAFASVDAHMLYYRSFVNVILWECFIGKFAGKLSIGKIKCLNSSWQQNPPL